jgi:hypothetical protein
MVVEARAHPMMHHVLCIAATAASLPQTVTQQYLLERIDITYKEDENSKRGAAKYQFIVHTSKQN